MQGRELFNIDNGITFISKYKKYTVLYIFATTKDNLAINNIYTRDISLFKRFISFFEDRYHNLLLESEKNKIYLPEKQIIMPSQHNKIPADSLKHDFYLKTPLKRFFIDHEKGVFLTKKEAECAAFMIDGATSKQIARAMQSSYKTVEQHIYNIKQKYKFIMDSSYLPERQELINFLKEAGIAEVIFYKLPKY